MNNFNLKVEINKKMEINEIMYSRIKNDNEVMFIKIKYLKNRYKLSSLIFDFEEMNTINDLIEDMKMEIEFNTMKMDKLRFNLEDLKSKNKLLKD
jgi:hypothetical protein